MSRRNIALVALASFGYGWSFAEVAAHQPFDGFMTALLSMVVLHLARRLTESEAAQSHR